MDVKVLEDLGLSNVEAKVYLALLEIGSAAANKIAEKSGIHRRTVYDALETLIEKGLVSFVIEANKKHYQAQSPERFLKILENKRQDFLKALPELKAKKELAELKQETNIYRGKLGLKNVFEAMIEERKTICLFGSGGKFREVFGEIYADQWDLKARENKLKIKAILSEDARKEYKASKETEVRYTQEHYDSLTSTTIFGDNVAVIIYSEQPVCFLIKSKEVASSYMHYFDAIWKIAKR